MNRQQGHPVAPPVLRAVTGSATGNGGEADPVAETSAVVPMAVAERAGNVARRAVGPVANAARELWLHPDRFLHSFAHPEPETMKEHWVHVQSRAWVPEELTGTPEKVVAVAGVFHHLFVAYPLKAAAKGARFAAEKVDEVADRPLRLYGLLVFLTVLFVLLFVL